ncbi:MAG: topoisomerase DNA-binding C4 zinc finger domain-containing protein [Gammaproteobacteria bacterium]|nr:topoisomerase DNA-binding C4 zinc finger domain-containing protein [Gammaproteobacteria bacterium]
MRRRVEATRRGTPRCRECGSTAQACPRCDGVLLERTGPYGPFGGCSNHPACTLQVGWASRCYEPFQCRRPGRACTSIGQHPRHRQCDVDAVRASGTTAVAHLRR